MGRAMSSDDKINDILIPVLLAGSYAVEKKFPSNYCVPDEMRVLESCLKELGGNSFSHKLLSFLGTSMPSVAIKLMDRFSHGLAYQYAARNEYIKKQFLEFRLLSTNNTPCQIINLGAGFDTLPDLLACYRSMFITNIDTPEIIKQREELLRKVRPDLVSSPRNTDMSMNPKDPKSVEGLSDLMNEYPTFIVAKGLFPYLSENSVKGILKSISNSSNPVMLCCSFPNNLDMPGNTDKKKKKQENMNYQSAWTEKEFRELFNNFGLNGDVNTAKEWMRRFVYMGEVDAEMLNAGCMSVVRNRRFNEGISRVKYGMNP